MSGRDNRCETSPLLAEVANALHFGANTEAASAEDAFVRLADDNALMVAGQVLALAFEQPFSNPQLLRQYLQLAIAVAFAGLAVLAVVVQQEFNNISSSMPDFRRVGLNDHSFPNLVGTCG